MKRRESMEFVSEIRGVIRSVKIVRNLPDLDDDGFRDWCKVETSDGLQHITRRGLLRSPQIQDTDEIEVREFPISNKKALRVGHKFRPIAGSGPRYNGLPTGETGRFVCKRIWRRGEKTYVTARSEKHGGLYDLFVDGPSYESVVGSIVHPYRLKLLK